MAAGPSRLPSAPSGAWDGAALCPPATAVAATAYWTKRLRENEAAIYVYHRFSMPPSRLCCYVPFAIVGMRDRNGRVCEHGISPRQLPLLTGDGSVNCRAKLASAAPKRDLLPSPAA